MDEWNMNSTFKNDYGWKRAHLNLISIDQSTKHERLMVDVKQYRGYQRVDYGWI
jgi:hypothetical protein